MPPGTSEPSNEDTFPDRISYRQELGRKALHLLTLAVPAFLLWRGKASTLPIVAGLAVVALAADIARAKSKEFNRFIRRFFGFLMRRSELEDTSRQVVFNGATWVLVGASLSILFYDEQVAAAALCIFLIGDAAAALIGRPLGRIRLPGQRKTLEGSLAFFIAAGVFSFWLPEPTPLTGLAGAAAGAVAEAIPLPVNDNVRVPVLAGAAMVLTRLFIGI